MHSVQTQVYSAYRGPDWSINLRRASANRAVCEESPPLRRNPLRAALRQLENTYDSSKVLGRCAVIPGHPTRQRAGSSRLSARPRTRAETVEATAGSRFSSYREVLASADRALSTTRHYDENSTRTRSELDPNPIRIEQSPDELEPKTPSGHGARRQRQCRYS